MTEVWYAEEDKGVGFFKVVFIANGRKLVRSFDSEYLARKFVEKVKRSRTCKLVSYPVFG